VISTTAPAVALRPIGYSSTVELDSAMSTYFHVWNHVIQQAPVDVNIRAFLSQRTLHKVPNLNGSQAPVVDHGALLAMVSDLRMQKDRSDQAREKAEKALVDRTGELEKAKAELVLQKTECEASHSHLKEDAAIVELARVQNEYVRDSDGVISDGMSAMLSQQHVLFSMHRPQTRHSSPQRSHSLLSSSSSSSSTTTTVDFDLSDPLAGVDPRVLASVMHPSSPIPAGMPLPFRDPFGLPSFSFN